MLLAVRSCPSADAVLYCMLALPAVAYPTLGKEFGLPRPRRAPNEDVPFLRRLISLPNPSSDATKALRDAVESPARLEAVVRAKRDAESALAREDFDGVSKAFAAVRDEGAEVGADLENGLAVARAAAAERKRFEQARTEETARAQAAQREAEAKRNPLYWVDSTWARYEVLIQLLDLTLQLSRVGDKSEVCDHYYYQAQTLRRDFCQHLQDMGQHIGSSGAATVFTFMEQHATRTSGALEGRATRQLLDAAWRARFSERCGFFCVCDVN